MASYVWVDICVNRHENGSFSGQMDGLMVEQVLQLQGPYDGVKCEYKHFAGKTKTFKIGKLREIKVLKRVEWYGNLCWDRILIPVSDLVRIINYLMNQPYWTSEAGDEVLSNNFDKKLRFNSDIIITALKNWKED